MKHLSTYYYNVFFIWLFSVKLILVLCSDYSEFLEHPLTDFRACNFAVILRGVWKAQYDI